MSYITRMQALQWDFRQLCHWSNHTLGSDEARISIVKMYYEWRKKLTCSSTTCCQCNNVYSLLLYSRGWTPLLLETPKKGRVYMFELFLNLFLSPHDFFFFFNPEWLEEILLVYYLFNFSEWLYSNFYLCLFTMHLLVIFFLLFCLSKIVFAQFPKERSSISHIGKFIGLQ